MPRKRDTTPDIIPDTEDETVCDECGETIQPEEPRFALEGATVCEQCNDDISADSPDADATPAPVDTISTLATRMLPVELMMHEFDPISKDLCAKLKKIDQISASQKMVNESYKGQIAAVNVEISNLRQIIESRKEIREVAVDERLDFTSGKRVVIRLDTGEVVESRDLTQEERQLQFEQQEA